MPDQLRDINLSFNSFLSGNEPEPKKKKLKNEFIVHFRKLISKSEKLGHLNLNGMSFDHETLTEICSAISKSRSVHAVHLSDNGICLDHELYTDIVDMFSIDYCSLPKYK